MPHSTPLLLLLDGVLSHDEQRISDALAQIEKADLPLLPSEGLAGRVLTSALALEQIVSRMIFHKPEWACVASQRDGSLPLHFAASIGSIPLARRLLNANRVAAITPNQKGKIPLHYAAREGRGDMVEFFLTETPETATIRSKKDKLALHFASAEGHWSVVRALVRSNPTGASIPSKKGKVALHFAARWGHLSVAKELLSISPETVSALDYEGSSPHHDAAREGQFEMMKLLVHLHPQRLQCSNIRGEIPLFPAVRSGNLELVSFMIHSWPSGGKHVLRTVREADNVEEWNPDMLELCLRGAVDILADNESTAAGAGAVVINDSGRIVSPNDDINTSSSPTRSVYDTDSSSCEHTTTIERSGSFGGLDIHLPRSKSPILEQATSEPNTKKRSGTKNGQQQQQCSNKRSRQEGARNESPLLPLSELWSTSKRRSFLELHAALECGASDSVLNCVLDRHGESQVDVVDELGRMPIHIAMEAFSSSFSTAGQETTTSTLVDILLERVWKPNPDACCHRDYLGRLPLHLALMNRADAKLVQALLQANPSSAIEHCDVLDERFMYKLPLEMALAYGCDLSSIYMLLRSDPSLTSSWTR